MTFFSGILIIDVIVGVVLVLTLIDIFVTNKRKKRKVKHGVPFLSYRIGYEMLGLLASVLYASAVPTGWLMVPLWFCLVVKSILDLDKLLDKSDDERVEAS